MLLFAVFLLAVERVFDFPDDLLLKGIAKGSPPGVLGNLRHGFSSCSQFFSNPTDLPPHIGVFAAVTAPTREFGTRQRNHWINGSLDETPELLTEMQTNAFKLSIQIRRLLLMAAYLPRASSQFLLAAGLHLPLWPNLSVFPCYRADLTIETPYDSIKVLAIFNDSLGALHMPKP
jgi:hypothetical protein